MVVGGVHEGEVVYFSEELCERADDALRFAYLITLDRTRAHAAVRESYKRLAGRIGDIVGEEDIAGLLVKECWGILREVGQFDVSSAEVESPIDVFKGMSVEARLGVAAIDFIGLGFEQTRVLSGVDGERLRKELAAGRAALLSSGLAKPS